jgi:IS4 transposase
VNDVNFLDLVTYERNAFYILDRGYLDFERLYTLHTSGACFVTRAKVNTLFERRYSQSVDKTTGVMSDQIIFLTGTHTKTLYPETLRRVKYRDLETNKVYVFLTNNTEISARMVADLYKQRWQVELFFKWIKQHLKIKVFWGYSENAVKTQICIALCTYLIVSILKKRLSLDRSIYEILQILSVSLFDKIGLVELFSECELRNDVKGSENMVLPLGF